jgi:hypothetical protein
MAKRKKAAAEGSEAKRDQFSQPYEGPDDPQRPRGEPYEPPLPGESRDEYEARTAHEDEPEESEEE